VKDFIRKHNGGKEPCSNLLAHCWHELMQGNLDHVLDEEFIHAVNHGDVVLCRDNIKCRLYLRVFTYLADYSKKYVPNNYVLVPPLTIVPS
jgi:hypothetical protein